MERGLSDVLTKHFLFNDILVDKYYPLLAVFLVRFETTKKRLQYLTFDNIIVCTEYIFESWRCTPADYHNSSAVVGAGGDRLVDVDEIDRHFVQELRDMRNVALDKDVQDLQKGFIVSRLEQQACTLHFIKSVDTNFRTVSRNLFTLASGLSQSKEFRDIFNDLVEKVIEPIKTFEWSSKELDVFFTAFITSWGDFKDDVTLNTRKYDAVYIRYMEVMKKCILEMYK